MLDTQKAGRHPRLQFLRGSIFYSISHSIASQLAYSVVREKINICNFENSEIRVFPYFCGVLGLYCVLIRVVCYSSTVFLFRNDI